MNPQQIVGVALQASIFSLVFALGLQASRDDVFFVLRRPAVLIRSLLAMFVILPLLVLAMITLFEFHPAVRLALVALALSPIPPLLPRRVVKSGGKGSYALGLMVTAALFSIFFLPLAIQLIGWAGGKDFAIAPRTVARLVTLSVVVPLLAGMIFRSMATPLAERIVKPITLIANGLLAAGAVVILVVAAPAMLAVIGNGTLLAIVALVVLGLAVGHLLGGRDRDDRVTLAISTACRHPGVALAVARATHPEEKLVTAVVLLYLLLNAVVAIPYVKQVKRMART